MFRYINLILGLMTAVIFYGFFGVVIPESPASDTYRSIVPAMKIIALILAIGVVVASFLRFAREKRH